MRRREEFSLYESYIPGDIHLLLWNKSIVIDQIAHKGCMFFRAHAYKEACIFRRHRISLALWT